MANYTVPIIETPRLSLRPFTDADLTDYARLIFANPNVTRYLPKRDITPEDRATRTISYINRHWAEYHYGIWAITDKSTGEFIGHTGLNFLVDTQEVEVDYALSEAYWGQGIATEAARLSLRYGFDEAGVDRIIALAAPENIASRKVMEHLGMAYIKDAHYFGLNVVYYAINRGNFRKGAPTS